MTKIKQWEINMIHDDYDYYIREGSLARNSISDTESIPSQKQKLQAIIYGDYWRAFLVHMIKNKKIPDYKEYKRHWLFENKEHWASYKSITLICIENQVTNITKPMINKGYSQAGKMWGFS